MRVKAKVSVGYDLDKMNIVALPDEQKIVISNLPKPSIISVVYAKKKPNNLLLLGFYKGV